jgi:hypothetical protein
MLVRTIPRDSGGRRERLSEIQPLELLLCGLLEESAPAALPRNLIHRLQDLVRQNYVRSSHDHLRQAPLLVTLLAAEGHPENALGQLLRR